MSETNENTNKDLLNALNSVQEVKVGDVVNGDVLDIDDSGQVFVGIENSGVEGVIPRRELSATPIENVKDEFKVGDPVKVVVIKGIGDDKEGGNFLLSIKRLEARKVWDEIQAKSEKGETINVTVSRAVRGGLVVDADGVRGFIPASMITDHFVEKLNQFKGQEFECKIVEVIPAENRLILSHREIVELERKEAREKIMDKLTVGEVVEGKVARLTDFGAFVDLGGIDGLVHVSEISYERVAKPSDVLKVGEEVKVKVLSVDEDRDRIALSIKQTQPQPWDDIEAKAPKGSVLDGTVKRLVDFGAFVEVFPGVEGLVHISQISHKHVATPSDVLKVGQKIQVKVLDVQPENHRLALSMRALEPEPENAEGEGKQRPSRKPVSDNSIKNAPEEESGFTLGDIVGKALNKDEDDK
ncbi:30S ribosomal protein S1 [Nicoliella spurrieriana]|uniref:30S ribosomal protein S1 n=1 Tax=Nicoliella spurrieriana TaxID=2925830 RepID=A0A976X5E3_9LACO|nr:30S ribosomal protein S1 [Nicoliella spurrieriana]UQS86564.1 30S ribosomal protein S1 [Nicoliella spurrieriana]